MQKIIIVCGATASGKSSYAMKRAEDAGGIIINADSQQLYKDFPILTARPSRQDEARIPHRLYGILSTHETSSAALWLKHAHMEIDWALSAGKTPVVTGGTGLYIHVLMHGIANIPDIPPEIRAQSAADLSAMGGKGFHERLSAVDKESAAKIRPSDPQRLIRAYAVWLGTGKPLSWWQAQKQQSAYHPEVFDVHYIDIPRDELYARINARTVSMLKNGAIDEVREFLKAQNGLLQAQAASLKIIGLNEIIQYISGTLSLDEACAQIQQSTRNYAKRQLTWFRHRL